LFHPYFVNNSHVKISIYYSFTFYAFSPKIVLYLLILFRLGVLYMLRNWQSHSDYQQHLIQRLSVHAQKEKSRLILLDKAISKLYLLNLDNLLPVIKPLYPDFGRPAKNQQGIIRSLILMINEQEYSITKWAKKVQQDELFFDICGFDSEKAPGVGSYYDLLWRLWLASHKKLLKRIRNLRPFSPKPNKRFKPNQKLPNKHPGIVKKTCRSRR